MKRLSHLLICAAIFLTPALADDKSDLQALDKEVRQASKELRKAKSSDPISGDAKLKELEQAMFDANQAMVKARKAHPEMKELQDKDDQYLSDMIKARASKDQEKAKAAQSAYTKNRMELEKKARSLDDLKPLYEKVAETSKAFTDYELKLLREDAEFSKVLSRYDSLRAKRQALREKISQQ